MDGFFYILPGGSVEPIVITDLAGGFTSANVAPFEVSLLAGTDVQSLELYLNKATSVLLYNMVSLSDDQVALLSFHDAATVVIGDGDIARIIELQMQAQSVASMAIPGGYIGINFSNMTALAEISDVGDMVGATKVWIKGSALPFVQSDKVMAAVATANTANASLDFSGGTADPVDLRALDLSMSTMGDSGTGYSVGDLVQVQDHLGEWLNVQVVDGIGVDGAIGSTSTSTVPGGSHAGDFTFPGDNFHDTIGYRFVQADGVTPSPGTGASIENFYLGLRSDAYESIVADGGTITSN